MYVKTIADGKVSKGRNSVDIDLERDASENSQKLPKIRRECFVAERHA